MGAEIEAASTRHDSTPTQQDSALHDNGQQSKEQGGSDPEIVYIQGMRLHLITASICVVMFLVNLEISIVMTSLVSITEALGGFDRASWVISAYMLGYVAVLIIFSKLSDIYGRKLVLLISLSLFIVFSAACGASQTIIQLIVFRAFQGVGGAGCFALGSIIIVELVPPSKYAAYVAVVALVFSTSMVLGPILGGVISRDSTWRWIFLLNVPAGIPVAAALLVCMPWSFPHQPGHKEYRSIKSLVSKETLTRVDFLGVVLILFATLSLVASLEEAGLGFSWDSAFVVTLLVVSGALWVAFLAWERYVTIANRAREPVFPWRFAVNRSWIGMLISSVFLGACWTATIYHLAARFQIAYGLSPVATGVRLIAFTAPAPIGSIITSGLAKKGMPPVYMILVASAFQLIAFAVLGASVVSDRLSSAEYGLQVIAGLGCGTNISLLPLLTPFVVEDRDKAVAMGTISQFRIMGGAIGVAVVTAAMNSFINSHSDSGRVKEISNSPQMIGALEDGFRREVLAIFLDGYRLQLKILAGLAGGQLAGALLIWKKKQIKADGEPQ